MRPFVFRAEAALALRREREQRAQRTRAEAEAALSRAEAAIAESVSAIAAAFRSAGASAHDPALVAWHRNWMTRLKQDRDRRLAMARDRRTSLDAATTLAHAAHRDVLALERLRERAWAAWMADGQRQEQKDLDWLGNMRFMQQRDASREEDQ